MTLRPAIFFDRDGTLNDEVGYLCHPDELHLLPGAAEAVRRCNEQGVLTVVVTNQAAIARGLLTEPRLAEIHERLGDLLAAGGAHLDAIYHCPHHPEAGLPPYRVDCRCRKPRPGMIEAACGALPIDLARSCVIGDKLSDMALARAVGISGILVRTGYGTDSLARAAGENAPDHVADHVCAAVEWALEHVCRAGLRAQA